MSRASVRSQSATNYVGSVPGLPGCHTQGKSINQLLERMQEAIALWLEVEGKDAPNPLETVDIQEVSVLNDTALARYYRVSC